MENFRFSKLIIVICAIFTINACSMLDCAMDPEGLLENFDSFVDTVEEKNLDFESRKWETYDSQFENYLENCYEMHEEDFTGKQRRQFWFKVLKYLKMRYGTSVIKQVLKTEDSNNLQNLFKDGFMDDLKDRLNSEK